MTDNTFRIDPRTGKLSIGPAASVGGTELISGVPTGGSAIESPTRPESSTVTVVYDGNSLVSAAIVDDDLIVTYSNGATDNLGPVRGTIGLDGQDGADGQDGIDGTNGIDGQDGVDGTNGIDGVNGKTILYGTVDPDGALGTNGDFYINLTTTELWGPKGFPAAGWNTGVSLIGPAGSDGTDGVDGVDGTNGTNGTDGLDGADGVDGIVPTYLNVTAVRAIDHTTLSPLDMIAVASNTNLDDFRAGLYSWVATSLVPDNDLTVIAPTSIGSDAGRFHAANFMPAEPPVLPAAATDEASAVALVNAIRDALIAHNLAR